MKYLKEDEVVKSKTKLTKAPIQLEKYDMYYVDFLMKTGQTKRVRTFCEKGTFPEFNSEEFNKLYQKYGPQLLINFFAKRLVGEESLMKQEGRDDFIYLGGDLLKNGYIASREMIQSNGKTGQQNFDDSLFNIKLQVQAEEYTPPKTVPNNEKEGKTYVIGDIHGMYGSYEEIMKKMTPEDHLIILGDVIDRGNGGIKIIQDIMQKKQNRQNNPEITFMLGNHEMQFIQTVKTMLQKGLKKEDLITIVNRRGARARYGAASLYNDPKSKKEQVEWKKQLDEYNADCQKLVEEKGLTESEIKNIEIWLYSNRGTKTIFDYLKGGRVNGAKEQQEIFKFLCDSYVVLPQNIKGKDYLFVHAMPPKDPQMLSQMKQSQKGYKFKELTREQYKFMLQERDQSTYEQAKAYGFTTVCGHTPEFGEIIKDDDKGFIRIDAGCGHQQNKSKLALYCIDDGKVEYIDERETAHEEPVL